MDSLTILPYLVLYNYQSGWGVTCTAPCCAPALSCPTLSYPLPIVMVSLSKVIPALRLAVRLPTACQALSCSPTAAHCSRLLPESTPPNQPNLIRDGQAPCTNPIFCHGWTSFPVHQSLCRSTKPILSWSTEGLETNCSFRQLLYKSFYSNCATFSKYCSITLSNP